MWDKTPDQLDPAALRLLEIHLAQANGLGLSGGNHAPARVPRDMSRAGGASSGLNSANRPQRTVYVGNVKPEITEPELEQFLNSLLQQVPGRPNKPGNAIVDISMKYDKAYAFVEFKDTEDADICIALDGASCKGVVLRLRRTNNYHPPPGYDEQCKQQWKLQGVIPTHVEDGPNKLYFSGLPKHWDEEAVVRIAQQVGELGAFTLVRDKNNGESKGYAFFSYANPAITDQAIQFLNSLNIPDAQLACKRARVPGQPMGMDMDMDMGGSNMAMPPMPTQQMPPGMLGVGSGMPHQPPPPPMPVLGGSRILVLGNMVTNDELQNDAEYKDILEDIHSECSKHGPIDQLLIPRPGEAHDGLIGKIFLAYQAEASAQAACQSLAGRTFNQNQVTCSFLPEGDWAQLRSQFPPK